MMGKMYLSSLHSDINYMRYDDIERAVISGMRYFCIEIDDSDTSGL